jgi:hypothetical protein
MSVSIGEKGARMLVEIERPNSGIGEGRAC